MIRLAWLALTDDQGRDYLVSVDEISRVRELPDGSQLIFRDGSTQSVHTSASDVMSGIGVLWDGWLEALGDPT